MATHETSPRYGFSIPLILLVEDDDNDAFGIETAFKKLHLASRLRRVSDGSLAIEYLQGNAPFSDRDLYPHPSLVLLDLRMPGKDGFEVLRWIRANPQSRHVPVVVLSGFNDELHFRKALEAGANSYLVKPRNFFDFAHMMDLLDAYWRMHRSPQLPQSVPQPCRNER